MWKRAAVLPELLLAFADDFVMCYRKKMEDKMSECTGCKKLTSDNLCLVGALYGMKRCIRTTGQKVREHIDGAVDSAIDQKKMKCSNIAKQLFNNKSDCYTMIDDDVNEIPAMSQERFVEIVADILLTYTER